MVQPENITHKGGTMLLETPYFGLIHIANTVGKHPNHGEPTHSNNRGSYRRNIAEILRYWKMLKHVGAYTEIRCTSQARRFRC